ncbi:unnamed protein product [Lymnaea stagnalis]|uniref:Uncharacterized protein n=1 Tax=Lymnaea stagnalis TaxID=6523 RepID=A0AAV2HD73_LYMST
MATIRNMITATSVCVMLIISLGVESYPYPPDEFSPVPYDNNEDQGRSKRINQMSCHCCSNSFNSNCCYQCMQSMGKRSQPIESVSSHKLDVASQILGMEYEDDESSTSQVCHCCILQMSRSPSAASWPCCDSCDRRIKTLPNLSQNSYTITV